MKKYALTRTYKVLSNGRRAFRIKASKSFGNVKVGDLGGFIESEKNLSHDGYAWVSGNARVYGSAQVSGNAWVSGNARVFGDAQVFGSARVFGDAQVFWHAHVSGNARVFGSARVLGDARVFGYALVSGNARVSENALVAGNAHVSENALVAGNAQVSGNASVFGDAQVDGQGYFYLQLQQNITYDGRGWLSIGCKGMPVSDWLTKWKRVAIETRNEGFAKKYYRIIKALVALENKQGV